MKRTKLQVLAHGRRMRRGIAMLRSAGFCPKETSALLRVSIKVFDYHWTKMKPDVKGVWEMAEQLRNKGIGSIT
jgi:hypothetical protein